MLAPFAGVILIYSNLNLSLSDMHFVGVSAALLSGVLYALSLILFKKESRKFSPYQTVFYQNIVAVFVFLPFFIINPFPTATQISVAIVWAFLIGLVGYILFFSAITKMKSATAGSIVYLEVALAIVWGAIMFKETLYYTTIIGGALIIASTILLRRDAKDTKIPHG